MDEKTWVHHYDPETKIQNIQWKHKGSPTPKKFKVLPSAGKVLLSFGMCKVLLWWTICNEEPQ